MKKANKLANSKDMVDIDSSEGGILAHLWREIITRTKLINNLKYLLDRYANKGGKRSKSTIQGYFYAPSMTWKTFVFLVLKILPVTKMTVSVTLTYTDKTKDTFSLDVYSNDLPNEEEDKENEDDKIRSNRE